MERLRTVDEAVERVLSRVGNEIRMALPLALGKPSHFVNALYQRVKHDPSLSLDIYTALTLELPKPKSELERRFLQPLIERLFGNFVDLDYELDRVAGRLPGNVRVREFYFPAGKHLERVGPQRDYISTNYTFVARDLMQRNLNVVAQQVAVEEEVEDGHGRTRLSLSSNPDVTLDLLAMLRERAAADLPCVRVAQRNDQLPFMYGDAEVGEDAFDCLIDAPELSCSLFGVPKPALSDAELMMGLYSSTLVRDGGELQIGIGALGDAISYALLLRHRDNDRYRDALARFGVLERFGDVISRVGALESFEEGLFGGSEMLVDSFMDLIEAGVVKRRVYDDVILQRLLGEQSIGEQVSLETLALLRLRGAISRVLTENDVRYLKRFGILRPRVRFEDGKLVAAHGVPFVADLDDPAARARLRAECLGERLQGGAVAHAAFFLGSPRFYQWLRELPRERRALIHMRSVTAINQLYGHEALDRLHRRDARFFNTGMMATLLGAVVSDALDDGRVVSGVGGQYNFVAMAHALPDGRSVLKVRSTRENDDRVQSNIVWSYGHVTIPRHLRDLLITEYGIADLRGKTDQEVVEEMLNVADSRFQGSLLSDAKRSGKLPAEYVIPDAFRNNTPEAYEKVLAGLRAEGLFSRYPLGSELTPDEQRLAAALTRLKAKVGSAPGALEAMAEAVVGGEVDDDVLPCLQRMGLDKPEGLRDRLYQRLLAAELRS